MIANHQNLLESLAFVAEVYLVGCSQCDVTWYALSIITTLRLFYHYPVTTDPHLHILSLHGIWLLYTFVSLQCNIQTWFPYCLTVYACHLATWHIGVKVVISISSMFMLFGHFVHWCHSYMLMSFGHMTHWCQSYDFKILYVHVIWLLDALKSKLWFQYPLCSCHLVTLCIVSQYPLCPCHVTTWCIYSQGCDLNILYAHVIWPLDILLSWFWFLYNLCSCHLTTWCIGGNAMISKFYTWFYTTWSYDVLI